MLKCVLHFTHRFVVDSHLRWPYANCFRWNHINAWWLTWVVDGPNATINLHWIGYRFSGILSAHRCFGHYSRRCSECTVCVCVCVDGIAIKTENMSNKIEKLVDDDSMFNNKRNKKHMLFKRIVRLNCCCRLKHSQFQEFNKNKTFVSHAIVHRAILLGVALNFRIPFFILYFISTKYLRGFHSVFFQFLSN